VRLVIDEQRCQGHALCYLAAPHLVILDELGYSQPASELPLSDEDLDIAGRIVAGCPEGAISVVAG
jgi:ferredoxin